MKKQFRLLFCLSIILVMVMSSNISAFAGTGRVIETTSGSVSVVPLSNNSILMSDGETTAIMSIKETKDEIRYMLTEGSKTNYYIYNKNTKQMYSSYTGNTILMDDALSESNLPTPIMNIGEGGVRTMAVERIVDTIEHRISYSKIASMLGDSYSTYDLAVTIVAIVGTLQGVALTTITAAVFGALKGALLTEILNGIKNNSSGGIIVTIYLCEITKHQGGREVTGYGYQFGGITTY